MYLRSSLSYVFNIIMLLKRLGTLLQLAKTGSVYLPVHFVLLTMSWLPLIDHVLPCDDGTGSMHLHDVMLDGAVSDGQLMAFSMWHPMLLMLRPQACQARVRHYPIQFIGIHPMKQGQLHACRLAVGDLAHSTVLQMSTQLAVS